MLGLRLAQRRQHFAAKAEHVPVQRVERCDAAVGEAMHDFEAQAARRRTSR